MPDSSRLMINLAKVIAASIAAMLLGFGICAVTTSTQTGNAGTFGLVLFLGGFCVCVISLVVLVIAAVVRAFRQ